MQLFEGFGQDNALIFKAATTCYRSEEHTKKSPDDMATMMREQRHYAMVEFSWFVFRVREIGRAHV